MFDIGISELLVIGIVALVVIGPERLPRVARTVGHLLGRLQRYVGEVKSEINREMRLEDLKRFRQEVMDQAQTVETTVRQEISATENAIQPPPAASLAVPAVSAVPPEPTFAADAEGVQEAFKREH
ncbi:MAG TPA: Sec-independent protein translocase protein TatB [Rhodocyclaceae bacterium]|nr:Sec-independent protein translocase protein TatB [Rhodocyclaceae bacterium]